MGILLWNLNHLESHNNQVKGRLFSHHRHSGRLPRVDYWVYQLINDVIPRFIERLVDAGRRLEYRDNMRHAPTTSCNRQPTEPRSSDNGVDPAGPLFARFLEEIEEDVESDFEDPGSDHLSGADTKPALASPLGPTVLSPDGKSIIVNSSMPTLDELDLANLFLDDPQHALDSENITPYLPENTPLPLPPSHQPPAEFYYDSDTPDELAFHPETMSSASVPSSATDQSNEIIPDSELLEESSSDTSLTGSFHPSATTKNSQRVNLIVTAFQQLLINEDQRERLICQLLDEGVLLSQLDQHMTPYIRNRLRAQAESSSPQQSGSKISLSSPIRLSLYTPDLLPFDKQRKEKRHESRGCR